MKKKKKEEGSFCKAHLSTSSLSEVTALKVDACLSHLPLPSESLGHGRDFLFGV